MIIFFCTLISLIAVFLLIIFIRCLAFKPKKQTTPKISPVDFDRDSAVDGLARLVKIRTVSYEDASLEDASAFESFEKELEKLFPCVFETCELTKFKERSILLKWSGRSCASPTVLMAHYDVVPADENGWEVDPFGGVIRDGCLWGRGTLDTKITLTASLFAAESLIKRGFVPKNDVYFAFSGNEEINGGGAPAIVDYFERNKITLGMVLDEGGAVVENVFPGVKKPCAVVGFSEKGMLNVRFEVVSRGGHASAPPSKTPIGELSKACVRIQKNPFKMKLSRPALEMFDTLGRHSTLLYRLIFSNLWCFSWVLDKIAKKSGGEMNALLRTTVAFTQAEGSPAPNVIPTRASMVANVRLNPLDTAESAQKYLEKVAKNENITLHTLYAMDPSRISTASGDGWDRLTDAILSTWGDVIVSPYLMIQCSDSRHYDRISDKVYRFCAMDLSREERATIHGHNERIRLECIHKSVEFYIRFIESC